MECRIMEFNCFLFFCAFVHCRWCPWIGEHLRRRGFIRRTFLVQVQDVSAKSAEICCCLGIDDSVLIAFQGWDEVTMRFQASFRQDFFRLIFADSAVDELADLFILLPKNIQGMFEFCRETLLALSALLSVNTISFTERQKKTKVEMLAQEFFGWLLFDDKADMEWLTAVLPSPPLWGPGLIHRHSTSMSDSRKISSRNAFVSYPYSRWWLQMVAPSIGSSVQKKLFGHSTVPLPWSPVPTSVQEEPMAPNPSDEQQGVG